MSWRVIIEVGQETGLALTFHSKWKSKKNNGKTSLMVGHSCRADVYSWLKWTFTKLTCHQRRLAESLRNLSY